MSDYDAKWENSGAFPSRNKGRPIIPKIGNASDSDDADHIFVDEGFDGVFDAVAGERLMATSHASSETPAISNTTTSVVRNALKKNKESSRVETIHPYNMFRSKATRGGKREVQQQQRKKPERTGKQKPPTGKQQQQRSPTNTNDAANRSSNRPSSSSPKHDPKREKDDEGSGNNKPIRPSPNRPTALLSPVQDEPSSVITDDHHQHDEDVLHDEGALPHEHRQYVYDYMAEGASARPPMSVSGRSRRHGGGSKHHLVRHTLPTSQKVTADPNTMLSNLFVSIEEERHLHRLTAQHLRAIHNWLLFSPSILLTLVAGLVVLIFEADIRSTEETGVYASILVGVLSLVSVVWQALGKQLDLGVKSALHDACSVALKRLSEDILLTVSSAESIPAEYVALIGEKYGQAADACPLTIPYKLEAASSHLSDMMGFMLRPPMGQHGSMPSPKQPKKLDLLRLYATAFDELSAEVIKHVAFPFALPNPRRTSEAALRNFKSLVTEGREIDRSKYYKSILCPCLGTPDEERNLFDVLPTMIAADPIMMSQASI